MAVMICNLALALMFSLAAPAAGNAFLHATPTDKQMVAARVVEETLLAELALTGRDVHLLKLQEELRSLHAALPKNAEGKLDAAVVRYGLHRFFVQTRGWFVQGLQPSGEAWSASSPLELVKDRVPSFIQGLLEKRVHGSGLDLQDLAAFAATIQDLVHAEAMQNLMDTFASLQLPLGGRMSEMQLSSAVEVYLMGYLLGTNVSTLGSSGLATLRADIAEVYPAWGDVRMWAEDLQWALAEQQRRASNPFMSQSQSADFDRAAAVVQELGHRFGSFQNQECRGMKNLLVDMEHRGTGRVLLSDFYRGGLDGNWQFGESVNYLRALGALDESNSRMPSVIIANYMGSPSNCVSSSSFYSVCCMDECESLMGQLELTIGEPSATPSLIAGLVAGMSSDTVDAPRNLSQALLQRLDEIAVHHGGRVPLHGRLFAQFMHHAYPRECPYPHTTGTTNPMTPDEWLSAHSEPEASAEEISRHIAAGSNLSHTHLEDAHAALPWSSFEELVASHDPEVMGRQGSMVSFLSKVVLLVAFGGMTLPFFHGSAAPAKQSEDKLPRYLV